MTSTNAVIFTCTRHAAAAAIAAKAASRFFNIVLAIDKDDAGFPDEGTYKVVRTGFQRMGNLNGIDCALGIANVLMENMHNDWVVKLDSDMVIHTKDTVDGCDVGGYVHPHCPTAFLGCYYSVSRPALEYAISCIKNCEQMGVRNFAEDVLITSYARDYRQSVAKRNSNKMMSVWHPKLAPNPKKPVANFGNHRVNGEWHHEDALRAMSEYAQRSIDTLQDKTLTTPQ